jgi:exo-beta-1,3-glucanase (GH17 family)
MPRALGLFAIAACVIGAAWWWLGLPVAMPAAPLQAGEKLHCVSYTPFRGSQNPLTPLTKVEPWQIEEDFARLAPLTNCVRSYSIEHGLDRIPEIAQRHGLKVLHGIWLGSNAEKNREQIETSVALAKRYPEVIQAIIVGNEVLLRGEMSAIDLANTIRGVKAQVPVPVTYADVWEFWLRNRVIYDAVDFVTIHILPYWEDIPIPAQEAGAHVEAIRKRVASVYPDKEILIGETGWPSAGRMREGARPSPVNQARVLHDVLALAKRENYRVTVIEAFDQPWKRQLEGTVGGHWGIFDAYSRDAKFTWGEGVSNHRFWKLQAAAGVLLAGFVFASVLLARRWRLLDAEPAGLAWLVTAANAVMVGVYAPWAAENMLLESLGAGGWVRSAALVAVAVLSPALGSVAFAGAIAVPAFARVIGPDENRTGHPVALALGLTLVVLVLVAVTVVLGLAFDPRYRDFPYAPLTAAVVPFLWLVPLVPRAGRRGTAETAAAIVLLLSAGYILFNERFTNWQSLWFCGMIAVLAFTLLRARDARSSG